MSDQHVTMELFRATVKDLLDLIISARKDAVLAKMMARRPVGVPDEEWQALLAKVDRDFEDARRRALEAPARDVLQFLRDFQGPIQ